MRKAIPTYRLITSAALLNALLALSSSLVAAQKVDELPQPTGYVSDLAGAIDAASKQQIEALATEVDQKTGAQVAVLTVNSLDDMEIEDYAVRAYRKLGVGKKGEDRGVLLLLAPSERKYRVEVGYGLEPIIPDGRAGDIGRSMRDDLRAGRYGAAAFGAVSQIAQIIAADKGVALTGRVAQRRTRQAPAPGWLNFCIPFAPFLIILLLARLLGRRGRRYRRGGWFIGPYIGGWGGGGFGGGRGGWSGGGGFGGFGGGMSGGGGASGSW